MKYKIIENHSSNNEKPLMITKGTKVKLGRKSDDSDGWADWIYCYSPDGNSEGWAPIQFVQVEGEYGIVLENYSAKELTVEEGDMVEGEIELNGWIWCSKVNKLGLGWVPKEKIINFDLEYIKQIEAFIPVNEQECQDKKVILDFIGRFSHNVLLRENEIAHITSSGFVMNEALDKVLMVHHNIMNAWAWTGGHADGDCDLLHVAIKEAKEETGINTVTPLSRDIVALDILTVSRHVKRDKFVNSHLHLSVAFILVANENEKLIVNEAENSGVKWIPVDQFTEEYFNADDVYLYNKLIKKAKEIKSTRTEIRF